MGCARKQTATLAGFVCLEEYRLAELTAVYDSFVLHSPAAAASPTLPALPPPNAVPSSALAATVAAVQAT